MRHSASHGPEFAASDSSLDRAADLIVAAAGDLGAVAQVLVDQAAELTGATVAAMYELRGGLWVRMAVSDAPVTGRSISFSFPLPGLPVRPQLTVDTDRDPHPLSGIARALGAPTYATVPMPQWPDAPGLVVIAAGTPGALDEHDLFVLSGLVITAGVAAQRTPVSEARTAQAGAELAWHQQMLEGIARGVPMEETLTKICLEVESRYPGTHCSVLLCDPKQRVLHHAAAPNLPRAFREAIDGLPIEEGSGACGTAAARALPVIVENTLTDPRTAHFTDVATDYNLRSVWSMPLLDVQSRVVGTFALYRNEVHSPSTAEMAGVAALAGIAGMAIERHLTERAMTEAAQRDPLTSLPNRSMFNNLLAYALSYARQTSSTCAVMLLDLDGFKFVNDSLGHVAGDKILVAVAERLSQLLPDGCTMARFGGDEFVLLVEDATVTRAHRIADAIDAALVEPFELDGGEYFLTTAIGIVISDGQTTDPDTVIRDADAAMFAAKGRGPGRRAVFDNALRDRAIARMTMEGELRRAIRDGTLDVVYQPVMHVPTRLWCGAEALLRWDHSELGAVSPTDFVALAEELGLVGQLSAHVLDQALTQAQIWDEAGIPTPIGINISPTQLTDPGVVDEILGPLHGSHVRPELIYLEITESAVMASPDTAKRLLGELADAGVQAVIDDFGTGHSSIARLSELPVTGVKVDKSFLVSLGVDRAAARIVAAVIELAHAFGLTVTAEGVESPAALKVLEDLGCDQAQGFLFGRPVDAEVAGRMLRSTPESALS